MRKGEAGAMERDYVIPNSSGTVLVMFSKDALEVMRFHILAWRVRLREDQESVWPILCETLSDNAEWCYEQTCQEQTWWIFPNDRTFDSFTSAQAHAIEMLSTVAPHKHA